jgi:nitroreductase
MRSDPERRAAILAAISGRRSVRGFLDAPVPRATMEEILVAASHAPSATNTQPWRVYVLTGAARDRLSAAIAAERATAPRSRRRNIHIIRKPGLSLI